MGFLDLECSSHIFPSVLYLIKPESIPCPALGLPLVLTSPPAHLPLPDTPPRLVHDASVDMCRETEEEEEKGEN